MHRAFLLAILALSLCLCSSALATTITITSTAVTTTTLGPSGDSYNFSSSSVNSSASGDITFQSGSFTRGSATTTPQTISFSFADTITLNGVTETITVFGQDSITANNDVLTIFAGTPISFGSNSFKLDAATFTASAVGQAVPLALSASISPVPEPTSLTLSGIGFGTASLLVVNGRRRSHAAGLITPDESPGRDESGLPSSTPSGLEPSSRT